MLGIQLQKIWLTDYSVIDLLGKKLSLYIFEFIWCIGGWNQHVLELYFWELMIFEWNDKAEMLVNLQRFLCHLCYSLCLLSMWLYSKCLPSILFSSYLNIVFNSFRIHTCYALAIVSYISQIFLLNLIWNSSCDALYWWIAHVSFLFAWKSMNDYDWMVILPLLRSHVWNFCIIFIYLTPLPNGICVVSTI